MKSKVYDDFLPSNIDAPDRVDSCRYGGIFWPDDATPVVEHWPKRLSNSARLEDEPTVQLVGTIIPLEILALERYSTEPRG